LREISAKALLQLDWRVNYLKAVGIIAEYNPFHNGHLWHLEQARQLSGQEAVVAVMSGNFVQRGEPAMADKWKRAQMAVGSGVDLVLELPTVFAVRSAENFATAGIRLLASLGVVASVAFGAENPEVSLLTALAKASDERRTAEILKQGLDAGQLYAAALGKALSKRTGLAMETIAAPNNILAVEYIRAIRRYAPGLNPVPVARTAAGYHDKAVAGPIASATAIRQELQYGSCGGAEVRQALPAASAAVLQALIEDGQGPVFYRDFDQMILTRLRVAALSDIEQLPDVSEGLHNKIKDSALQAATLEELFEQVKSRRYSRTRLQRIVIHALLGSRKDQLAGFDAEGPLYARVLAFNDRGRALLRVMRSKAAIPVITKTTRFLSSSGRDGRRLSAVQAMLAADTLATDLYVLARPNPAKRQGGLDFRTSPLYLPSQQASV
jgi:predicted nucleotidyltransferase